MILESNELVKKYRGKAAVDNISLAIESGKIPNTVVKLIQECMEERI